MAPGLAVHMDELACSTWYKVQVGPRRGIRFDERSLTDHNLFELDREGHDAFQVFKIGLASEAEKAGDLELWIGGSGVGWVGIRLQARVMKDMAYEQLGHEVRGERQYELLLRSSNSDGLWPMYCFYNGWDGPWPVSASSTLSARRGTSLTTPPNHALTSVWGSSVVRWRRQLSSPKGTPDCP